MHLDNTYNIKEIAGEKVIILRSKVGADMTKLISFNTTSEKLWNEFINKDFTVKDAADFLVKEYGIDPEKAYKDSAAWAEKMKECSLLKE